MEAGEIKVKIGIECTDELAKFCLDMLNFYLKDNRRTHVAFCVSKTPQGEIPYEQIRIEEKAEMQEEREK